LKNPKSRIGDLNYLKSKSREFKSLEEFLNDLALTPPNEKIEVKGNVLYEDEKPLTISTIHSAKGLEWKTVFIARVIDGEIPSNKSLLFLDHLEEERRLFYVAITRAKDYLYLTAPNDKYSARNYFMRDEVNYVEESRFLTEIENKDSVLDSNMLIY
jgi:DNA helicase-2/ATP-dependent DNA helicase PcrA